MQNVLTAPTVTTNVQSTTRVENVLTITVPTDDVQGQERLKVFTELLKAYLAQHFGGFTVIQITGGWADNGDEFTDTYTAFHKETGYRFIVTSVERVDDLLKQLVTDAKLSSGAPVSWIDFNYSYVNAGHFQI